MKNKQFKKGGSGSGRKQRKFSIPKQHLDLKKSVNNLIEKIEKECLTDDEKKKDMKMIKERMNTIKSKDIAFLKADRLIHKMQGYSPISDDDIKKSLTVIPDILKDPDDRPPKNWWNACINRAKSWADDPAKVCGSLWHSSERYDPTRGGIAPGKGAAMKEAYGKMEKGVVRDIAGVPGKAIQTAGKAVSSLGEAITPKAEDDEQGIEEMHEEMDREKFEKWLPGALLGAGIGGLLGHPIAGAAIGAGAEEVGGRFMSKCFEKMADSETDLENIDPEILGQIVLSALREVLGEIDEEDERIKKIWPAAIGPALKATGVGLAARRGWEAGKPTAKSISKAVAEPIGSKFSPQPRKPKDFGGDSEIVEGTRGKTEDLRPSDKNISS